MAASAAEVYPAAGDPVGCTPLGEQRMAVLVFEFPGAPLNPAITTVAELRDIFFSETKASVARFYRESSYGRTTVTGDAFGPFQVHRQLNSAEHMNNLPDLLRVAEKTMDLRNYNRIFIIWPAPGTSGWSGWGGRCSWSLTSPTHGTPINASVTWLYISTKVPYYEAMVDLVAHEGGHNFGWGHSQSLGFGLKPLGPPWAEGTIGGYGDYFCNMGSPVKTLTFLSHHHARRKLEVGWLDRSTNVRDVEANGNFRLQPLETATSGLKALRVRRTPYREGWLWLEYRQPVGFDSLIGQRTPQIASGALIHLEEPIKRDYWNDTFLLDMTALESPGNFTDAALAAGKTWVDPYGPLSMQVTGTAPDGLDVGIRYDEPCGSISPGARTHGAQAAEGKIDVAAPSGCRCRIRAAVHFRGGGCQRSRGR